MQGLFPYRQALFSDGTGVVTAAVAFSVRQFIRPALAVLLDTRGRNRQDYPLLGSWLDLKHRPSRAGPPLASF
jgi:hypothetical protein